MKNELLNKQNTARNTKDSDYGKGIHHGENLYECGNFIVHFFNRETIEFLSQSFDIEKIDEFEEGALPRRLYFVVLKKNENHS
ncbi:MAG: hypothetical protein ACRCU3_10585 [Eubacteriaceae bacterium]